MKLLYLNMLKLDIAAISGFPTITIHSLPAGSTDVLATGFDTAHVQVTTGSGLRDRTVTEHTLGLLLKRDLTLLRNARLPGAAKHPVYIE
ncbi:uncharacterized protein P884DRAFT_330257 [Thermothelomyces heterothallicus CBS 202.75]|uniref:uncharacterized protein n=1 Tax=Thermothelomyces heterothallicus CBS 202.75 TaxID=1149848 RepID=UPI00374208B6